MLHSCMLHVATLHWFLHACEGLDVVVVVAVVVVVVVLLLLVVVEVVVVVVKLFRLVIAPQS